MSSTYSNSLRVELIGSGDQAGTWGTTTDNNFAYIFDSAIAGVNTVTVTSINQALTYINGPTSTAALNQSIYAILKFNSAAAASAIYAPPVSKQYIIWNNSSFTITIYNSTVIGNTTAAGAGVAIAAGGKVMVWSDGTDFYDVQAQSFTGVLLGANGGTGVANTSKTITLGGNLVTSGAFATTLTSTGTTAVTLPTTGTLATLAGSETLTNKTINGASNTITNVSLASGVTGTLPVANGGTGTTSPSIVAGTNITVSGTWPNQTINASSGGGGTVTSVNGSGGSTGLTLTGGPITSTGTLTLGGTLAVANGGTGSSSLAGAGIITTGGGQTIVGTLTTTGNMGVGGGVFVSELFVNTATSLGGYGAKGQIYYNSSAQAGLVLQGQTATSNNAILILNYLGTPVGSIFASSTNTTFNDLSDYRMKNSIAPMTGALAKVALLKPCTYKWNVDGSDGQGFIAHELQTVVPQAATGKKDATNEDGSIKPQGVDPSKLVATLTAAIQELKALVDAQAARIAVLESR